MSKKGFVIAIVAIVAIVAVAIVVTGTGNNDFEPSDAVGTYTLYDYESVVMDGEESVCWRDAPEGFSLEIVSLEDGIASLVWKGVTLAGTIDKNGDIMFLNKYDVDGIECTEIGEAFYENDALYLTVTTGASDRWFSSNLYSATSAVFVKEGSDVTPQVYEDMFETGDIVRSFATYCNEEGRRSDETTAYNMEVVEAHGGVAVAKVSMHGSFSMCEYYMLISQMNDIYARAMVVTMSYEYSFQSEIHKIGDTMVFCEWDNGYYGNATMMASMDGKVHSIADIPNISGKVYTGIRYYSGTGIDEMGRTASFFAFGNYGNYTVDIYDNIGSTVASIVPTVYGYELYFQCPGISNVDYLYGYGLLSFDLRTLDLSTVGINTDGTLFASCERLTLNDDTGGDDLVGVYYDSYENFAWSESTQVSHWSGNPTYSALVISNSNGGIIRGFYNYLPFVGTFDGSTLAFSSVYFDAGDVFVKVYGDRMMLSEHYLDGNEVLTQNKGYVKLTDTNTDGKGHYCPDVPEPFENTIEAGTVLKSAYGYIFTVTDDGYDKVSTGQDVELECILSDSGIYTFDMYVDGELMTRLMGLQLDEYRIEIMGNSDNELITFSLTIGADEDYYTLVRSSETVLDETAQSTLYVYYFDESGTMPEISEMRDISGDCVFDFDFMAIMNNQYCIPAGPISIEGSIETADGTNGHIVLLKGLGDTPLAGYLRYEGDSVVLASSLHMNLAGGNTYYADVFATVEGDSFTLYGAANGDVEKESAGIVCKITKV